MGSTDKKYGNRVILVQIFKKYENHTFSVDKTGEKEKNFSGYIKFECSLCRWSFCHNLQRLYLIVNTDGA